MKAPLTQKEIKIVREASDALDTIYRTVSNTLAHSMKGEVDDLRLAFLPLEYSRNALGQVSAAVADEPYLTSEHVVTISTLKNIMRPVLSIVDERRKAQTIKNLSAAPTLDILTAAFVRHHGHEQTLALSKVQALFNMVEGKTKTSRRLGSHIDSGRPMV